MAGNTTCPGRRQLYTCDSSQARECCTMDPCSQPNCPSNELSERGNDSPPIASLSTRNLKNDDEQSYTPKDDPPKTEASQPSTSESPTEPAKTKSDSGITHTIPNSSIVTVTKHTVVFSEAPSPSKASISESSTLGDIPTSTCSTCNLPSNTTTPEQHEAGGGLPLGAIAGVATGGVIVLALVAIIWILYRRKRRGKGNSYLSNDGDVTATDGYEKMTPHTTGTESLDPFAPFGGKFRNIYIYRACSLVPNTYHIVRSSRSTSRSLSSTERDIRNG